MALGKDQETLQYMLGDWMCDSFEGSFKEFPVREFVLDMYLYYPGCDRQVPRPLDLLLICVAKNEDLEDLKPVVENFNNVVFKVVVG
jgi:hypothetical protein